jgi:hypothetical protein
MITAALAVMLAVTLAAGLGKSGRVQACSRRPEMRHSAALHGFRPAGLPIFGNRVEPLEARISMSSDNSLIKIRAGVSADPVSSGVEPETAQANTYR